MIKVYVINLTKDIERLEKINKHLKYLNIEFERFPAVYGKDLNPTLYPWSPRGQLGCSLSHINVAKKFLETTDPFCLVIEDDAVPLINSINDIYPIINNMPSDTDSIQLFCLLRCKNKLIKTINQYTLYQGYFPMSNLSYILTRKGAVKQSQLEPRYHFDWTRHKKLNVYNIFPFMFTTKLSKDESSTTRSNNTHSNFDNCLFDGGIPLSEILKFKFLHIPHTDIDITTFDLSIFILILFLLLIIGIVIFLIFYYKRKRLYSNKID